jgi:proteic killer suppression protein
LEKDLKTVSEARKNNELLEKTKRRIVKLHSIRINDQWRILFTWQNNSAESVQITDFHE